MSLRTRSLLLNAGLWLAALVTLAPVLWMVSVSFMPAGAASAVPVPLVPSEPTLEHYRALFERLSLGRYFANSLFLASAITGISLLLNALAGYAFAKLRFGGRERLFSAVLAALVIPAQVAMLPLFLELKALGLVNTFGAVILPASASLYGIYLMRQFALAIPDELLDAARIDGASELRIFVSLVLPWCGRRS